MNQQTTQQPEQGTDTGGRVDPLVMCEFSQGVCFDGAAILKDGQPMQIEQIMRALWALQYLVKVKEHKDTKGKDRWYYEAKGKAWRDAKAIVCT